MLEEPSHYRMPVLSMDLYILDYKMDVTVFQVRKKLIWMIHVDIRVIGSVWRKKIKYSVFGNFVEMAWV